MTVIIPSQIRYVWVAFNASGTILDHISGSSVVKNGTGDFTITYADSMPSQYYFAAASAIDSSSSPITVKVLSQNATSCRILLLGGSVEILGIGVCRDAPIDPDGWINFIAEA